MLDPKRIAAEALALDDEEDSSDEKPAATKPAAEPTEGEDEGEALAADEVFDAVKLGDRDGFRTALRAYVDIIINGG